ncbi:hypothetical protein [Priestia megaterium]|uniref:hypothetical protein n=1 Tax=Priestia megaterium TaxID=1404 RepID=UPI0025AED6BA|nr:hypothetical protein [Priestia megaterium]MDN3233414.1 hypothetical protein [Priestia megaterium]
MKKVLGCLMAFALAFGVFGGAFIHKAEAAFTTKQNYTYNLKVKKSNSAVNHVNHQYFFDWTVPTGGGTLITDVYYRVKTDGNVELIRMDASSSLTWPFYIISQKGGMYKPYTGQIVSGYSKHIVGYNLVAVPWDLQKETYNTDVQIIKGKPVDKYTTNLKITFNTTGRDSSK